MRALLPYGWGEDALLNGGWASCGLTDLFMADIPGYGPGRGSRLVLGFLRFILAEGLLHPWDYRRLAWEVDQARVARGLDSLGAEPAWDWARSEEELPGLFEAFYAADTELTPFQRHMADPCLHFFATFASGAAGPVCFGAVSPSLIFERLSARTNPPGSEQNLCLISAVFTRWLGRAGILEPRRASELAAELNQLALAFAHPKACA
ncbi:MAG: hypothetical protein AAF447_19560 [Myxococcota bacterium]